MYDFSEGLKGWLKIPKGGKVKKGWKKVYAIVQDYKIILYDKEKDADDDTVKPLDVFDLRYELDIIFIFLLLLDVRLYTSRLLLKQN